MKEFTYSRGFLVRNIKLKLSSMTTVHGLTQLVTLQGKRSALWSAMLAANLALTIAFLIFIKNHYNSDQIVTKIDANCNIQRVPYPAVSICNFNMISMRESHNIVNILKNYKISNSEIDFFFRNLYKLKDFSAIEGNLSSLEEIMKIMKLNYYTIDNVMEQVHQKCENMLLHCEFNRKEFVCKDWFRLTKTYEGYCCIFNYAALNDANQELPFLKERSTDWEYYVDNENGEATNIISTSEFGRSSGLSVLFNVEPHDYPSWSPTPYYGAKVLVSDPNDYPETTVLTRLVPAGESVELKVLPLVFESEPQLKTVAPDKRKCWFHDEVQLEHTDRYSFETCKTECRMDGYRRLCGCLPYKYPTEKSTRLCEFQDINCLVNITVWGTKQRAECNTCYTECVDKKYSMKSDAVPLTPTQLIHTNLKGSNASELAALRVYFKKATCNCYKMSRLMDSNYFVATYGGVFSLTAGGSLMTIFEISYLLVSSTVTFVKRKLYYYCYSRHFCN